MNRVDSVDRKGATHMIEQRAHHPPPTFRIAFLEQRHAAPSHVIGQVLVESFVLEA